ncbi:hypothetical protein H0H93_007572 [Arthromyces matolae]|nr:hypothetical protein H0H93_007572 [Arthromyces matolae]
MGEAVSLSFPSPTNRILLARNRSKSKSRYFLAGQIPNQRLYYLQSIFTKLSTMKSTLFSSVFAACVLATLLGAVSASPLPHLNVNTNNALVPRDGPPATGVDYTQQSSGGNSVTHTGASTTTIRFGDLVFECAHRAKTPMYFGWSQRHDSSDTSSGQSHVPTHPPCDETGHRSADNASHGQAGGGVITSATEGSPGKSTLVQS